MSNEASLVEIINVAKKIVSFMETRDRSFLDGIFAPQEVVLIDSFAPYIFQGDKAADRWADGFITHAKNLTNLRGRFGEPQEYSTNKNTAFISLPLTWEGESDHISFHETGGLALVLVNVNGQWKVQSYGWAATGFHFIN